MRLVEYLHRSQQTVLTSEGSYSILAVISDIETESIESTLVTAELSFQHPGSSMLRSSAPRSYLGRSI